MRTKNELSNPKALSFIEAARRKQIIAVAIDVIAELGYAQASIGQIAQRANISKGVITYHFASKDDLMHQVVTEVLESFAAFVRPHVEAESTAAGALRAFILANAAFMRNHANQLTALLDISANARASSGQSLLAGIAGEDVQKLQVLLQEGQDGGEFRRFDTCIVAVSILALRNSMLAQFAANPTLDLDQYARELATMVDLATRNSP